MASYSASVSHSLSVTQTGPGQETEVTDRPVLTQTPSGQIARVSQSLSISQDTGLRVAGISQSLVISQTIRSDHPQGTLIQVLRIRQTITATGTGILHVHHSLTITQSGPLLKNVRKTHSKSIKLRSHGVGYKTNVENIYAPWRG